MITGERLAHYRLVDKIGEGGMGVVWKALDTRLDRPVALKLLPAELEQDPQRLQRLEREAQAIAALNHPNVVTIHSIEEDRGRRFLVMELVTGATLDRIIPAQGLRLQRILELGIDMADGVHAAHERSVVHCDLKPVNVMVADDGRLRILDFGVAKSRGLPAAADDSDAPTRTMPGPIAPGTLAYMSPEQVEGKRVDRRSDIFSLGLILFEMATGRRPFGDETEARSVASLLRDACPPLTELRPDLPRQLERIVAHALEKEPERRFQTALDLRNELQQLQREIDRGVTLRTKTDEPATSVAVLPLENLSQEPEQAWFADGMTDALISNLARIRALKVISRTSSMRYKGIDKSVPEIARELSVGAVVEGSVLRAGDRLRITAQLIDAVRDRLLWADSYEQPVGDVLEMQGAVARKIAEKVEVELTPQEDESLSRATRMDPACHEACLKGRHFWYRRTTESVRKGLECFEQAIALDPTCAPAHAGVADSYIVDGGRYLGVSPDVAYARARAAAEEALRLDDSLAEAHTSLAAVMTDYDWDWEGAEREYRRAIELNPSYATAHSWYAEQLSRMGRHDEAVAEALRARELDPLSMISSVIVSWIYYFARRYDDAVDWACRTLELDSSYATAHRILGWIYEEVGRYGEAIAAHKRAGDLTGHSPNFVGQIGRAYALAGREEDARRVLDKLLAIGEETYVSSLDIAIIHTALGETDAALDWFEKAHEERADHLPYSKVNPRLDPLRDQPRFKRVLEQMGLTEKKPVG